MNRRTLFSGLVAAVMAPLAMFKRSEASDRDELERRYPLMRIDCPPSDQSVVSWDGPVNTVDDVQCSIDQMRADEFKIDVQYRDQKIQSEVTEIEVISDIRFRGSVLVVTKMRIPIATLG